MNAVSNLVGEYQGELRISSETIATGVGAEHRAVLQLIGTHEEHLERFGTVAFEMRPLPGGGNPVRIAQLTEQQVTLLMTFMKNTAPVISFKVAVVEEFYRMKQALTPAPAELSTLQIIEIARQSELARIAAEQQVAELAPKAAHTDTMRQADGLRTIGDIANDLKVHAASNFPALKVKQADVFDLAGVVGLIIRGNTVRHNQPTSRAIEAGWVKPKDTKVDTDNHGSFVKVSARLTPRGYGRLWDAAVTNLNTFGQVLAPQKGIAA